MQVIKNINIIPQVLCLTVNLFFFVYRSIISFNKAKLKKFGFIDWGFTFFIRCFSILFNIPNYLEELPVMNITGSTTDSERECLIYNFICNVLEQRGDLNSAEQAAKDLQELVDQGIAAGSDTYYVEDHLEDIKKHRQGTSKN